MEEDGRGLKNGVGYKLGRGLIGSDHSPALLFSRSFPHSLTLTNIRRPLLGFFIRPSSTFFSGPQ